MSAAALQVLEQAGQAAALMDPLRQRLIHELREPDSAAGLARKLGIPRQKINYHLRELEKAGLLRLVEERRRRNCTERIVRATATAYLISPAALEQLGGDPESVRDRFSWAYLVRLAARAIKELAVLRRRADRAGKHLPTFALETDVRFSSPQALHGFTEELANEVARLAAKYQDDTAEDGRLFRFFLGAYPAITKPDET